ncbi:hypothetical protein FKM82_015269 [Ascaphus truei]
MFFFPHLSLLPPLSPPLSLYFPTPLSPSLFSPPHLLHLIPYDVINSLRLSLLQHSCFLLTSTDSFFLSLSAFCLNRTRHICHQAMCILMSPMSYFSRWGEQNNAII